MGRRRDETRHAPRIEVNTAKPASVRLTTTHTLVLAAFELTTPTLGSPHPKRVLWGFTQRFEAQSTGRLVNLRWVRSLTLSWLSLDIELFQFTSRSPGPTETTLNYAQVLPTKRLTEICVRRMWVVFERICSFCSFDSSHLGLQLG